MTTANDIDDTNNDNDDDDIIAGTLLPHNIDNHFSELADTTAATATAAARQKQQ